MPRSRESTADSLRASQFSQPSSSQISPSQSTQSRTDITEEERRKKVNDLVQFLLVMDQKKLPIKKRDINRIVLNDCAKAFNTLMEEASQTLLMVFGFKVVELTDKLKGSYILVNTIANDAEEKHIEWSEMETIKMGLVSIILSMIFMNGNVLEEDDLWHALRVFGLNKGEHHCTFGDVKSLITEEFVRQGYLEIKTQSSAESTIRELRWGQRAALEFKKKSALNLVSDIYQCEPQTWLHQWQQVQEEEGGDGHEPMEEH